MWRRLFSTPQPRPPPNDPERPRTSRPTAAPSASRPVRTPGSDAMPIDNSEAQQSDAHTQGEVHPHPEALRGCPDQPLHTPEANDQRDPAPVSDGAANDTLPQHQHQAQRTAPPQRKVNRPDRTNGHTYPREKRRPQSEKCNRSLRGTQIPPCPPPQVSVAPMLNHGQTMPNLGATTSSRLGRGQGTCSGT